MNAARSLVYLDTGVAIRLASGALDRLSKNALKVLEVSDLYISPMALVEMEQLFEAGRILFNARDIRRKLEAEAGLRVCTLPFAQIAAVALDEKWAHDPFDRLIVANAKANGLAPLISADPEFMRRYPRTVW